MVPDRLTLVFRNPASIASFVTVTCNFQLLILTTFSEKKTKALYNWGTPGISGHLGRPLAFG
jgi:hypothetical protein